MSADTYAMEATFLAIANLEEAPCEVKGVCGESASVAVTHVGCGYVVNMCSRHAERRRIRLQDPLYDNYCPSCRARNPRPEDVRFTNI